MATQALDYRKYTLLPTESRGAWTVVICRDGEPRPETAGAETYFEAVWQAKRIVDGLWEDGAPVTETRPLNPVSEGALSRLSRALRRRLADRLEDVFGDACRDGDLDTAQELLTTMGKMRDRRMRIAAERRTSEDPIHRARDELARVHLSGRPP